MKNSAYSVKLQDGFNRTEYIVVATSFDDAAAKTMERERSLCTESFGDDKDAIRSAMWNVKVLSVSLFGPDYSVIP